MIILNGQEIQPWEVRHGVSVSFSAGSRGRGRCDHLPGVAVEVVAVRLFGDRNQPRRRVAFHEAGHAAARDALGGPLMDVSINQHGGGLTRYKRSRWFGSDLMNLRSGDLRTIIAGPLVEARYSRLTLERAISEAGSGPESDAAQIAKLLRDDSLDRWAGKTKWLLWGHGRGIKDLAEALVDCGFVTGDKAHGSLDGKR